MLCLQHVYLIDVEQNMPLLQDLRFLKLITNETRFSRNLVYFSFLTVVSSINHRPLGASENIENTCYF